jgi:hypothetical protein
MNLFTSAKFPCHGRRVVLGRSALLTILLAVTSFSQAADVVQPGATAAPVASEHLIPWHRGMGISSLAGRPDSDFVVFSDQRRMRVGALRKIEAAAAQMRGTQAARAVPPGLTVRPAATGTPVTDAADLAAALKRSGTDTLELPSGKTLTAAQLRFLQPEVEKKLGHRLDAAPPRPVLSGPAIKVPKGISAEEWQKLMQKPDNTILESPSGKRVTVGEIRQQLPASRSRAPLTGSTTRERP